MRWRKWSAGDALAQRAFGWPQHLACYLRGAWRALAESDPLDLGDDDALGAALDYGDQMCRRYYAGRVEASRTDPSIILAVQRALADGGRMPVVHRATSTAVARLSDATAEIHRHNHPEGTMACIEAMLKAGVIEETVRTA